MYHYPVVAPPDPVRVHSLLVFTVPILCHIHRLFNQLVSSASPTVNRCYNLLSVNTSRHPTSIVPLPHTCSSIADHSSTINSRSAALAHPWMYARLLLHPQSVLRLDHTHHANTKVVQLFSRRVGTFITMTVSCIQSHIDHRLGALRQNRRSRHHGTLPQ